MGHDVALRICYVIEVVLDFRFLQFTRLLFFLDVVEFNALDPPHIVVTLLLLFSIVSIDCPLSTGKGCSYFIEFYNRKMLGEIASRKTQFVGHNHVCNHLRS